MSMVGNMMQKLATILGDLNFAGTGQRITGDFSNATVANRVMFQNSTTNAQTAVAILPNGTSQQAQLQVVNNSTPTNASVYQFKVAATEAILESTYNGAGSYLPMTFYTGGSERMRIDTSGNVGVGVAPSAWSTSKAIEVGTVGSYIYGGFAAGYLVTGSGNYYNAGWKYAVTATGACRTVQSDAGHQFDVASGSGKTAGDAITWTTGLQISTTGGVLALSSTGGLGYGTGAGGTVTQATSRTTGVTLNKPTGQITMFTAAGSATWSQFYVTNSLVAATDTIILTVNGASNYYVVQPYAAAGGFYVNFAAVSGTSSDTPKINFAIIKGATS